MPRFKLLPHTADIRLKIYGSDLEELFKNAAAGLAHILCKNADKLGRKARGHKKISISSENAGTLLADFLNRILSESNITKQVFPRVKMLYVGPQSAEAQLMGVHVDHFDEDIKAVSYHNAEIREVGSRLEAELVLDI